MCPILILFVVWKWLLEHEQSVAIWLEGLALVAIFGLELKEYFRQEGQERAARANARADDDHAESGTRNRDRCQCCYQER